MSNVFIVGLLYGQTIFYQEINNESGLLTDCIYDLAKDKNDLIYLGTEQGLYSYSGVKFNQIPLESAVSNSISDICFTEDGTLWCRNFSNQVFYSENGKLHPFLGLKDLVSKEIITSVKTLGKYIYVATYDAIYIINSLDKKVVERLSFFVIESIHALSEYLVVSTVLGDFFYIQNTKVVHKHQLEEGKYRMAGDKELYIVERNNRSKWIYRVSAPYKKPHKFIVTPFESNEKITINALNILNGNPIISSNHGTYLYKNAKWHLLGTMLNHSDIVEDFQGGYWIASIDNGLMYVPSLKITTILKNLHGQYFRNVIRSPKGYFVSTSKGMVLEITKEGKLLQTFDTKTGWEIEFIYFDKIKNRLYTSVGHFNYFNTNNFTHFYYGKGLAQDEFGNIFYGIHAYSAYLSYSPSMAVKLPLQRIEDINGLKPSVIRETRTRDVVYHNQTLYIAQVDKLLMYSQKAEVELKDENGKAIHAVKLTIDKDGNLWVATNLQGVFCFKKDKLQKHISVKNGLESNHCIGIKTYQNKIFVITLNGVTSIDKSNFHTVELKSKYAINNLMVNDVEGDENALFFVTKEGVILLENTDESKTTVAKLQFTGIKNEQGQNLLNTTKIPYSNNTIEITWSLLDYKMRENSLVNYRIIGFDNQWKPLSATINSVIYNNLPAGNYKFQITTNKDFSTYHSLEFSIDKPFWRSWWFLTIVVMASALIIWATVKITQRFTQKKQQLKTALIGSQLTALRSQMNPHFLYNALNSLQGLIYSNKTNEAGNYVSMFSDHLRYTLDISGKQWITVREEIESLNIYLDLEKLRFGDDFNYEIQKQSSISDYLKIPSMIIQPFVENAIKHGLLNKKGTKNISISFKLLENNQLQISIIDNGIGREQSYLINKHRKDKPKSFATEAIENRIDLLNQQYNNAISLQLIDLKEKGIATGTAVYLTIKNDENLNS